MAKKSKVEKRWKKLLEIPSYCTKVQPHKVIECHIPKKAITEIGYEYGDLTIVTKEYNVVNEDKYFKEG